MNKDNPEHTPVRHLKKLKDFRQEVYDALKKLDMDLPFNKVEEASVVTACTTGAEVIPLVWDIYQTRCKTMGWDKPNPNILDKLHVPTEGVGNMVENIQVRARKKLELAIAEITEDAKSEGMVIIRCGTDILMHTDKGKLESSLLLGVNLELGILGQYIPKSEYEHQKPERYLPYPPTPFHTSGNSSKFIENFDKAYEATLKRVAVETLKPIVKLSLFLLLVVIAETGYIISTFN